MADSPNDLVIDTPFESALSERYLVYPYADIPTTLKKRRWSL